MNTLLRVILQTVPLLAAFALATSVLAQDTPTIPNPNAPGIMDDSGAPQRPPRGQRGPGSNRTVDELSVVRVKTVANENSRSGQTLGREREGTGVVIDSAGLVLTIGYLITEAEKVELNTADGKVYPAVVVGFDNATGLGILKSLVPLPIKPIDMGESSGAKERDMVLIVGFDGVAPAYVVSKRRFVG